MNVLKNMELIFVVAAALGAATSYATASDQVITMPAEKITTVIISAKAGTQIPTVIVSAKRLTAAEKAALI